MIGTLAMQADESPAISRMYVRPTASGWLLLLPSYLHSAVLPKRTRRAEHCLFPSVDKSSSGTQQLKRYY
jgi:hypothetical protein